MALSLHFLELGLALTYPMSSIPLVFPLSSTAMSNLNTIGPVDTWSAYFCSTTTELGGTVLPCWTWQCWWSKNPSNRLYHWTQMMNLPGWWVQKVWLSHDGWLLVAKKEEFNLLVFDPPRQLDQRNLVVETISSKGSMESQRQNMAATMSKRALQTFLRLPEDALSPRPRSRSPRGDRGGAAAGLGNADPTYTNPGTSDGFNAPFWSNILAFSSFNHFWLLRLFVGYFPFPRLQRLHFKIWKMALMVSLRPLNLFSIQVKGTLRWEWLDEGMLIVKKSRLSWFIRPCTGTPSPCKPKGRISTAKLSQAKAAVASCLYLALPASGNASMKFS